MQQHKVTLLFVYTIQEVKVVQEHLARALEIMSEYKASINCFGMISIKEEQIVLTTIEDLDETLVGHDYNCHC